MTESERLGELRSVTLSRIDRAERNYRTAFFLAGAVELAFLVAFVLLADFEERTHVLLLIATIATYTIVILGLFALGSIMKRNTLTILSGIETMGRQ